MVTIHLAVSVPINPAGASPVLSAEQAWAALARKARWPQEFVPFVESCSEVSEADDKIAMVVNFKARAGVAHGHHIRETCTKSAPCRLDYDMEDGSTAVNMISTVGPGKDLILTFVFAWVHPDLEEGSAQFEETRRTHEETAPRAVQATVDAMRQFTVRSGQSSGADEL